MPENLPKNSARSEIAENWIENNFFFVFEEWNKMVNKEERFK